MGNLNYIALLNDTKRDFHVIKHAAVLYRFTIPKVWDKEL